MDYKKELDLPFDLRDYQKTGVEFLSSNESALLGDDMGLGKTIQAIVSLKKAFKEKGIKKTLIVVPNSLASNWLKEFNIWYKDCNVIRVKGDKEERSYIIGNNPGVTIVTYEQIRIFLSDSPNLTKYDYLIFDEAQRLKNQNSNLYQACRKLKANTKWMLTGTPLENTPYDIVSLFSILKFGLIQSGFTTLEIRDAIYPFLLRRLKKDVLDDLPDLLEENIYIDLTDTQIGVYNKTIKQKFELDKKDSSGMLALITELKKICNFDPISGQSGKLEVLNQILSEKISNNEKVIIFSQYVKTLEFIKENIKYESLIYEGSLNSEKKDEIINNFKNKSNSNVLLMSIKSGGVGLNLQEASTVIIFDRWWNPATENQAIARAHRLGNKNKVHAIKFIAAGTIEERIIELLEIKQDYFDDVVEGAAEKNNKIKLLDLLEL